MTPVLERHQRDLDLLRKYDDGAAAAIEIRGDGDGDDCSYGIGLYACNDMEHGTLLACKPLASVLMPSLWTKLCSHCFEKISDIEGKRCSGCHSLMYCNKTCQRGGWKAHKNECPRLKRWPSYVANASRSDLLPPSSTMLLSRLLDDDVALACLLKALTSHQYDACETDRMNMATSLSALIGFRGGVGAGNEDDDVAASALAAADLPMYLGDIVQLIYALSCNAFSVCDEEMQSIGSAIYATLSLVNHSCDPNCTVTFRGQVAFLRPVRPVAAGEQIFISYVDLLDTSTSRRRELKKRYYFDCYCARCTVPPSEDTILCAVRLPWWEEDDVWMHDISSHAFPSHEALEEATRTECTDNNADAVDRYERLCSLLGPSHFNVLRASCNAIDALIAAERFDTALVHCEAYLRSMVSALKWPQKHHSDDILPVHPTLGVELVRVAKLRWLLGDCVGAAKAYDFARSILMITHGIDHPFVAAVVIPALMEAREEVKHSGFKGPDYSNNVLSMSLL